MDPPPRYLQCVSSLTCCGTGTAPPPFPVLRNIWTAPLRVILIFISRLNGCFSLTSTMRHSRIAWVLTLHNLLLRIYLHDSFSKLDITLGWKGHIYKFGIQNWRKYVYIKFFISPQFLVRWFLICFDMPIRYCFEFPKIGCMVLSGVNWSLSSGSSNVCMLEWYYKWSKKSMKYHLQTLLLDIGTQLLHCLSPGHL